MIVSIGGIETSGWVLCTDKGGKQFLKHDLYGSIYNRNLAWIEVLKTCPDYVAPSLEESTASIEEPKPEPEQKPKEEPKDEPKPLPKKAPSKSGLWSVLGVGSNA